MTTYHYAPRNGFREPFAKCPSATDRIWRILSSCLRDLLPQSSQPGTRPRHMRCGLRTLLDARIGLILLWALVLWWGEVMVFRRRVGDCAWESWESWVGTLAGKQRGQLSIYTDSVNSLLTQVPIMPFSSRIPSSWIRTLIPGDHGPYPP